ncbi:hypothetical protein F5Y15DRAFT_234458 [Xylariaceae sp. FL0016]|nr:hypothetical protein F5Y15DRAFT_234458 [Xylariaceae sp. FL0016]
MINTLPTMNKTAQRFQTFIYSNASSGLLAYVVGVASGETFDRLIQRRLLEPQGMHETLPTKADFRDHSNVVKMVNPCCRGWF